MAFGFDETTKEGGNEFPYLTVKKETAKQSGIFYKDFIVGKWADGNPFIEVMVCNKEGQTTKGRYSVAKAQLYDNDLAKGITLEEKEKKVVTNFIAVVKNFTTKVLGDNAKISGNTLEEFLENTVKAIKAKPGWDKLDLTAMFIHNKDGFTNLRTFSPVVELTSNVEACNKLKFTDKELEGFKDNIKPSEEGESKDPNFKPTAPADDLPF